MYIASSLRNRVPGSGRVITHGHGRHYRQDGTGRDTYIMLNDGGFTGTTTTNFDATAQFKQSLRGYHRLAQKSPLRQVTIELPTAKEEEEKPYKVTTPRVNGSFSAMMAKKLRSQ